MTFIFIKQIEQVYLRNCLQNVFIKYMYIHWSREELEFEERFIINVDEMPLCFDIVCCKCVDTNGSKIIQVHTTGSEKHCLIMALAVSATGDVLLRLIIFTGRCPLMDICLNTDHKTTQIKVSVSDTLMIYWNQMC